MGDGKIHRKKYLFSREPYKGNTNNNNNDNDNNNNTENSNR